MGETLDEAVQHATQPDTAPENQQPEVYYVDAIDLLQQFRLNILQSRDEALTPKRPVKPVIVPTAQTNASGVAKVPFNQRVRQVKIQNNTSQAITRTYVDAPSNAAWQIAAGASWTDDVIVDSVSIWTGSANVEINGATNTGIVIEAGA